MPDIVERLREAHPHSPQYALGSNILLEAANEIAQVRENYERAMHRVSALEHDYETAMHAVAYMEARCKKAETSLLAEQARRSELEALPLPQFISSELIRDADRYRWLRARDLETIGRGGVFAGQTPENVILNGEDLDQYIDTEIHQSTCQSGDNHSE